MTQIPSYPAPNGEYSVQPRTSVMAVVSLILGILSIPTCCILVGAPLGLFAAALGIAALLAINARADGSLEGRGVAVTGVVTGTIGLFLSLFVLWGASRASNVFAQAASQPLVAIEAMDARALDASLSKSASARLDEAHMKAFRDAYQGKLGKFKRAKGNLRDVVSSFQTLFSDHRIQARMQAEGKAYFPIGAEFEKGDAYILLVLPQQQNYGPKQGQSNILEDLGILLPDGEPILLLGPEAPTKPDPTKPDPTKPDATKPDAAPAPPTPPTGG